MNYKDLFCKIFIDTDLKKEILFDAIIGVSSGSNEGWIITTDSLEIELRENEDFDAAKRIEKSNGFLYSRYFLEIEPNKNPNQSDYISEISSLLENLWQLDYRVTAACDFEEELPQNNSSMNDI